MRKIRIVKKAPNTTLVLGLKVLALEYLRFRDCQGTSLGYLCFCRYLRYVKKVFAKRGYFESTSTKTYKLCTSTQTTALNTAQHFFFTLHVQSCHFLHSCIGPGTKFRIPGSSKPFLICFQEVHPQQNCPSTD